LTSELDSARDRHNALDWRVRGFERPPKFWYDLDPSQQKGEHSRRLADAMAAVRTLWEEGATRDLWCVTLFGPPGLGKTHLLQGAVMAADRFSYYVTAQRFDQRVRHFELPPEGPEPREFMWPDERPDGWAYKLQRKAFLLAVDDFGMGHVDVKWTRGKLEELIDFRWSSRMPLLLSTNLEPDKFKSDVGPRSWSRLNSGDALLLPVTGKDLR
jgi:hypothetical protein